MAATDLERLVVQLEANSAKLTKELAKLPGDVDRELNKVERRSRVMSERVTAGFGRAGTAIAAFFSARAVIGFISRVSEAADKLQALSDRTGVGTDALQRLAGAAAKANIDTSTLNEALEVFARNVGRAAEGQGDLAKLFKELGLSAGDNLINTLLKVSNAVRNAKTVSEEYRITTIALGRANVELVGFLNQGEDAIRDQMAAFNAGLTPEAVQRLADFNQHWQEISVSFTNMAAGPASLVLRGLSDFLHDLESGGWRAGAQDLLSILSGGLLAGRANTQAVSAEVEKYRTLVAEINSLRKQLAAEQGPAMFPADKILRDSLTAQINAKEAELAALGQEIASRKVPIAPGFTAPKAKPFGGDGTDAEAEAAAKKKAEIEKAIVQDAFNIKQHFLEQEADAVKDAAALEIEIRQNAFDVQQRLLEDEADALADFHERADAAWGDYYERLAEKRQKDADDAAELERELQENRLQATSDFFGNLATLAQSGNETLAGIGKAAAIAQATIDGILAVQKALAAAPPPLNFALAASVGVATAANVARIASMERGGIVGPGGEMPLRRYRSGGIARGRQFAEFGEGDVPEAFVPLQDGRSIPVTIRMPSLPPGSSSSNSLSNVFHIDARGADKGAADQFEKTIDILHSRIIRDVNRRLPDLMVRAERRKL